MTDSDESEPQRKRVRFDEEAVRAGERDSHEQKRIAKRPLKGRTIRQISVNDEAASVWMRQRQLDRTFERDQRRHERHEQKRQKKREIEKARSERLRLLWRAVSSVQYIRQSVMSTFSAISSLAFGLLSRSFFSRAARETDANEGHLLVIRHGPEEAAELLALGFHSAVQR